MIDAHIMDNLTFSFNFSLSTTDTDNDEFTLNGQ